MVEMSTEVLFLCVIGILSIASVDALRQERFSRKTKMQDWKILADCSKCGINVETPQYIIRGGSCVNKSSDYPWMVSIRSNKKSIICGGAIIDNLYILTAAHCFDDSKLIKKVYFQTRDRQKLSHGYPIERIIIHPRYALRKIEVDYDIALVRLKKKIKCDEYKNPICLPDADFKLSPGARSVIAGWGSPKGKPRTMTEELHYGFQKNLDFDECVKVDPENRIIKDRALCQSYTKLSPCHGDSGGPLMHKIKEKRYAVGIVVSVYHTKCSPGLPALYTDVAKYIDWIKKEIKA